MIKFYFSEGKFKFSLSIFRDTIFDSKLYTLLNYTCNYSLDDLCYVRRRIEKLAKKGIDAIYLMHSNTIVKFNNKEDMNEKLYPTYFYYSRYCEPKCLLLDDDGIERLSVSIIEDIEYRGLQQYITPGRIIEYIKLKKTFPTIEECLQKVKLKIGSPTFATLALETQSNKEGE